MNKTSTASFEAIQTAIKTLNDKGTKPTQKNVQVETGLSIRTVRTYWARMQGLSDEPTERMQGSSSVEDNRMQGSAKRMQSSEPIKTKRMQSSSTPFERMKRRSSQTPTEIIPYKPWLK